MNQEVISVVLVPSGRSLKDFFELSNRLGGSKFHLDEQHLPHITIAQFIAPWKTLGELSDECSSLSGDDIEVTVSGVNFVPDTQLSLTWVELLVLKSEALAQLQKKVLDIDFAKKYDLQNWGVGDTYRPHITIGVLGGVSEIPEIDISGFEDLIKSSFSVELRVGSNGEYFSFTG